jgi:cytochrome o ubiquinol oxidase subunit 2
MKSKIKFILFLFLCSIFAAALFSFFRTHTIAMFDPQGAIALQERNLMIIAAFLMLVIVIPVFIMTAAIAWRYRASNAKAKYSPDWDHNGWYELLWWGFPCVIIIILGIVTWQSSHALDPYRPLMSASPPITIQVVALDWKWLFIYPDQNIATVNFIQFPVGTPVNFEITADAPMNSFWIPRLGGQIYAMPGMSTQLHLIADGAGDYKGLSANFSGEGFSGMQFIARASSQADFDVWLASVRQASTTLDAAAYAALAAPSENVAPIFYSTVDKDLYNTEIMKYLAPTSSVPGTMMQ